MDGNVDIVLKPTRTEEISIDEFDFSNLYQTVDGTIFYYSNAMASREVGLNDRLCVRVKGNIIDARIPKRIYGFPKVYKNDIFFSSLRNIYKCWFSGGINISKVRYIEDKEIEEYCGMMSRVRGGKKFVYNMWDDPHKDGLLTNLSEEENKELILMGVHGDKAIYWKNSVKKGNIMVYKLRENVILVESKRPLSVYTLGSNRYVYMLFCDDNNVYTFDTVAMELLPPFQIEGFTSKSNSSITGINNSGVITLYGHKGGVFHLMTALLPVGYHEYSISVSHIPFPPVEDRIENIEATPLWHIANDRLRSMGVPQFPVGDAVIEPATIVLSAVALLCYGFLGLLTVILTVLVQLPRPSVNRPVVCRCANQAPAAQAQAVATTSVANPQSPTSKYPWWFPGKVNASVNVNTTAHFE